MTRRMFVALMLGEELGARVEAAVATALGVELEDAGREGLRLYGARDLHLTLFFLGAVGGDLAGRLAVDLGRELAEARAPELRIARAGAFPRRGRERVLWLGVDGSPLLTTLQERVQSTCVALGFAADDRGERAFRPHVTTARVRRRPDGRPNRIAPAYYELECDLRWRPRAALLVESRAGRASAYRTVATFALASESSG